jgi:hypothetical protein
MDWSTPTEIKETPWLATMVTWPLVEARKMASHFSARITLLVAFLSVAAAGGAEVIRGVGGWS